MGCWTDKGHGICQSCGAQEYGHTTREVAVEILRVMRWHYGSGDTIGGQPYEVLLCPACSSEQRRRPASKPSIDQDALPIDWDQYVVRPKTQGGHTR